MFVLRILRQSFLMAVVVGCSGAILPAQTNVSKSVKTPNQQALIDKNNLTEKGTEAFSRGETEAARKLFEQAVKSNPNNWLAHNYLGILDDGAGDLKNAEIHFAKAARLNPKSAAMRNNYGAVLLKLNRQREAAVEFEASLKLDAKQANALINLAQIRFNENTPAALQASFDLFEKAALLVADPSVERSLVVIALRLKNKTAAAKHYKIYVAQLLTQTSQPDSENRTELGGALYEAGLLDEAEAELKAALGVDSPSSAAVVLLGRVYLARNEIKSAGVLLETAVARNQASAPIYSLLAVVYEKAGHYENAIPVMRLAINLQPESENYRFQYGLLLTNADAPAAAVIRLDEALKIFPLSSRLWLARGIANLKKDDNIEAARSINKALELDPKFAQAYAYLGLTKAYVGDYQEAIKVYEKALLNDANLAVVHQLIADALLQQPNSDNVRIEAELKKSIALAPDLTLAYLTLGKFYIRVQRWTEAAAAFNEVARRSPETAETYYQLGRVYARLKLKKESDEALAKFKELNDTQKMKSDTELREAVRRLADVRF